MTISVLGAGAFGTALAISLAQETTATLWCRNHEQALLMQSARENTKRLPTAPFPDRLNCTADLVTACTAEILLLAVPMQKLRTFVAENVSLLQSKTLVACCKGIEIETGLGPLAVIKDVLPNARSALLTGPSFAADIAKGLPTALTLACTDEVLGATLQRDLSTKNLRLYRTTDVIGAEIGGALKNVIAIGCGAVIGGGLGDSARAALMTRGYAEMQRLALARGARAETLAGLSGFGDLTLTCTSDLSRNYRLGLSIGRGETFDPTITVEGAATARATVRATEKAKLDMPITQTVTNLVDQNLTITAAVEHLFKRPLKEE